MSHFQLAPYHFQINLTSPSGLCYGFITLDGYKVLHIDDVKGFYTALGYTEQHERSGIAPEEYLWLEYRKDNCNKSYACLQHKIIDYLSRNLPEFKHEYAEQYADWVYRCHELKSKKIPLCAECKMC
jgi:hypothetical protein